MAYSGAAWLDRYYSHIGKSNGSLLLKANILLQTYEGNNYYSTEISVI